MITKRLLSSFATFRARYCTVFSKYDEITLNPNVSKEEEEKILFTLNTSSVEQLSRFDISRGRIKNLDNWKNKKGPFKSLTDILEVDGLGVKVLEKLCASIVTEDVSKPQNVAATNGLKNRRQFLTPNLTEPQTANLSSAVGLHIGPSGISWAKLCRDGNCLTDWGYHDFNLLPKKMLPTDTFKLAVTILDEIPPSEVYIFEGTHNMSPQQGNKPAALINTYSFKMELMSMLLALLNTSPRHCCLEKGPVNVDCNVYYLRANLPARLFKTLMGTERVSSTTVVSNILDSRSAGSSFSLPCTPVLFEKASEELYRGHSAITKEFLGQALLLVVTFMDICIYKNPCSLKSLVQSRK